MKLADSIIQEDVRLTFSEDKVAQLLLAHINEIVTRDDIAKALWGNRWIERYSEYMIDKTIYRLRKKLLNDYKITTLRNRGYILSKQNEDLTSLFKEALPVKDSQGITPPLRYLEYMNDKKNLRKTLSDLFFSIKRERITQMIKLPISPSILVINSFSFDNVDAIANWTKEIKVNPKVFFSNFDDRAIKLHNQRINKLGFNNFYSMFDDIRETRLKPDSFDLVINDFRLNFNTSHEQNLNTMRNTHKIAKERGFLLISVVVDPRYESPRYGNNQQKAPINTSAPSTFIFSENLKRFCFTVPYYKKIFKRTGFQLIKEFDIEEGKSWFKKQAYIKEREPSFRRYLLRK